MNRECKPMTKEKLDANINFWLEILYNCIYVRQIRGFNPIHLGSGANRMNRATNYRGEGGGCPLRGTKLIPYLTLQCVGERKWLGQRPNQPVPSVSPVWAIYPAIGNPDTKEQMRNAFIGPFLSGHFLRLKEGGGWLFNQANANRARSPAETGQSQSLWIFDMKFSFQAIILNNVSSFWRQLGKSSEKN